MIVAVFFVSLVVNFFYAVYVVELGNNKILKAAFFGECMVLANAFNVVSYVENKWLLIPMVAGGFLGTLFTKFWKRVN